MERRCAPGYVDDPIATCSLLLSLQDVFIVQLCFVAHILQVILGFSTVVTEEEVDSLADPPYSDAQAVERIWKQCHKPDEAPPPKLASQIKAKSMRFLRCAAVFFHYYTDVPLPSQSPSFDNLCLYLGLKTGLRDSLMILGMQDIVERC